MPLLTIDARLRAICLALPEAHEATMRRGPSYRVDDRIFALERPWSDWLALWCKVPQGAREIIIDAEPARFFIPPYFGAKGWIGVGLDEAADWREVEAFVRRGSSPRNGSRIWRLERVWGSRHEWTDIYRRSCAATREDVPHQRYCCAAA